MVRPERLLALHRQGRLLSSFHLLSHLWEASNITTRAISQFPQPVFHRQDTQHYGLQTKFTGWSNFASWRRRLGVEPSGRTGRGRLKPELQTGQAKITGKECGGDGKDSFRREVRRRSPWGVPGLAALTQARKTLRAFMGPCASLFATNSASCSAVRKGKARRDGAGV